MSEWTPGPWSVEYDERESGHVIRMGEAIETPWSFPSEQIIRYDHTISPDDDDEQEQFATADANAHLIAAAPDLYEALEAVLRDVGAEKDFGFQDVDDIYTKARAALTRARGEAK